MSQDWNANNNVTACIRAALADAQDWDELEALRASLREHMAEINRLRAAGRHALEAMEVWRDSLFDENAIPGVAFLCAWREGNHRPPRCACRKTR